MDLQSEASGTRVLTARHIAEKSLPEVNESVNTTVLCHSYSVQPDFNTYFTALQPYAWGLWSSGLLVLLLVCLLFVLTLRNARQHWKQCGSSLVVVLAVYPLVTAAGLIVLFVPRARLLGEAISQQAVMVALYHLYRMLVTEAGGEEKLMRKAGGSRLETRVPPCCCWPCCVIPRPVLDKRSLTWLRCLVLQLPVVQAAIYVVVLVVWAEDMGLYMRNFIYFQPFIVASILSGVWGVIMCVRTVEAAGLACRPRFLVLQLALLVVKVQVGIAKVLPEMVSFPCFLALHPSVVVHTVQYGLIMVQMLLLSLWAWRLYRAPPEHKVQPVVVTSVTTSVDDPPVKSGDWTERALGTNGNYM